MGKALKTVDGRHLRSKQTRQKLLKAARHVFLKEGFQNTTINQIIKLANTGYGTAYTHFSGKDDFLIVLMEDVMQQFFNIANIPFSPTSKEEARKVILGQVLTLFKIAESERDMMKVFGESIGLSSAVTMKWEEIRHKLVQNITTDIIFSQNNGLARKDLKADLVARQWFYSNEMYQWEIVHNRHVDSLDDIANTITTMYTDALYL